MPGNHDQEKPQLGGARDTISPRFMAGDNKAETKKILTYNFYTPPSGISL